MLWKLVDIDFSKKVAEIKPQRIQVPAGVMCAVAFDVDEKVKKRIVDDPSMFQRVRDHAFGESSKSIKTALDAIKARDAEAIANARSQATCDAFAATVQVRLKERMEQISKDTERIARNAIEHLDKTQAGLQKSKDASAAKIATQSAAIGAAVGISVASHATLTPFAGIAIARSSIAIAQEIARLTTDCSQKAVVIKAELKALKVIMKEHDDYIKGKKDKVSDNAVAAKLKDFKDKFNKKSVKETAMAVLSGVLGLETVSVKNCKKHIEDHNVYIGDLDKKSSELGRKLTALMDEAKAWEKELAEVAQQKPAKKASMDKALKRTEDALQEMLDTTIKVNAGIDGARQNAVRFLATIKGLSEGVAKWTTYVDTAVNAMVDIGIGIGDPGDAMEAITNVLVAVSNDATNAAAG